MKIVFVGNTNNYPLRLVKAMRAMGVQAKLVVYESSILHRPEGWDREFADAWPAWIRDFSSLGEPDFVSPSTRLVDLLTLLEGADGLVLNGIGPSLRAFVDVPSISWLTGSDLDYYANFDSLAAREKVWSAAFKKAASARFERALWAGFIGRQREGILRGIATSYFHKGINSQADTLLEGIGVDDESRFFIYMAEHWDEPFHHPSGNPVPRLLCGARLTWVPPVPPGGSFLDFKGTDIMIRGVARYRARNPAACFELRLARKGLHVAQTEALVDECGLGGHVRWLDEMAFRDFREEIRRADVVFDQLGNSMVGMAGLDAMAMGRPVIANGRPDVWKRATGEELPVCQAATEEEVCEQLERLLPRERLRARVAREARQFVSRRLTPQAAAQDLSHRFERARRFARAKRLFSLLRHG